MGGRSVRDACALRQFQTACKIGGRLTQGPSRQKKKKVVVQKVGLYDVTKYARRTKRTNVYDVRFASTLIRKTLHCPNDNHPSRD